MEKSPSSMEMMRIFMRISPETKIVVNSAQDQWEVVLPGVAYIAHVKKQKSPILARFSAPTFDRAIQIAWKTLIDPKCVAFVKGTMLWESLMVVRWSGVDWENSPDPKIPLEKKELYRPQK